MHITPELLERYHLGQCTPEEKQAVQAWLEFEGFDDERLEAQPSAPNRLNDDFQVMSASTRMITNAPEEHYAPVSNADEATRLAIWRGVSDFMKGHTRKSSPGGSFWNPGYKLAFAATFLLLISAITTVSFMKKHAITVQSGARLQKVNFVVERSSGTRALIHPSRIDFCGLMRIRAQEDVQLVLNSTCSDGQDSETVGLRKGETYLAFNHDFFKENELLVVNMRALEDLPPLMRRQLSFH